jgi:hypothetical protein
MRMLAEHLSDMDVARKNNFEIVIPAYDITLAVKSTQIPEMETEQVELSYGNGTVYVAGKTKSSGTWDINLRQLLEGDVVGTLVAWRRKVYNPQTGATGKPSEFKTDGFIYKYDPAGNLVEKRVVKGLWPTKVDVGDGDYDSGDPCDVTLSLSYDRAYREDQATVEATKIQG